jgi:hypothetical protein
LRIHQLRLPRAAAEEGRVEPVDVLEDSAGLDVPDGAGAGAGPCQRVRFQVRVGEKGDGLLAVAQVLPELGDRPGAGEAAGQADDRDLQVVVVVRRLAHLAPLW